MKETHPIHINRLHGMTPGKDNTDPLVAFLAESRVDKKDIRAKPVSWHRQTKSLTPFLTSHHPVRAAASLSPILTRVSPLKNGRYGKSPKSNPRLPNTSSIKRPAPAATPTALTFLIGCTQAPEKTSRLLSPTLPLKENCRGVSSRVSSKTYSTSPLLSAQSRTGLKILHVSFNPFTPSLKTN